MLFRGRGRPRYMVRQNFSSHFWAACVTALIAVVSYTACVPAEPLRAPADKSSLMAEGALPRVDSDLDLLEPLRRYWGDSWFRPNQESFIRSLLVGHDTGAVMHTGGGKSLCYQLPAVVSGKTVVVVSPLIALMQDQAAQLAQMKIPGEDLIV